MGRRISTVRVGEHAVFDVLRHAVELAPGQTPRPYFTLAMPDWVSVVAETASRKLLFVRQYRQGLDAETLETVGGLVDEGEGVSATALRELREETGYLADGIESLGWVHPNPALQANRCHLFLVRGARDGGVLSPDDGEDTVPVLLDRQDVLRAMEDGRITHALALVALHRALPRLEAGR